MLLLSTLAFKLFNIFELGQAKNENEEKGLVTKNSYIPKLVKPLQNVHSLKVNCAHLCILIFLASLNSYMLCHDFQYLNLFVYSEEHWYSVKGKRKEEKESLYNTHYALCISIRLHIYTSLTLFFNALRILIGFFIKIFTSTTENKISLLFQRFIKTQFRVNKWY